MCKKKKHGKIYMPKIVDCFTFYNEIDMLLFRLTELYNTVDHFVLVEATMTHSGNEKELFFENNKEKFQPFLDKIVHVVVDDMPNTKNSWDNENHQRRCIHRGIERLSLEKNDLLVIGDCDEIPDSKTLLMLKDKNIDKYYSLEMDMYYYNLTCKGSKWYYSKIIPFSYYSLMDDPQTIRFLFKDSGAIANGGWHFSYFGDVNFIKNKIKNFAHQEFNKEEFLDDEKIKIQIENNDDLFFREKNKMYGNEFEKVDIDKNTYLPQHYKMLL